MKSMPVLNSLLADIEIPKIIKIRQKFAKDALEDVAMAVRAEINNEILSAKIKPGMQIAITVGSRGLDKLPILVKTLVQEVQLRGAVPFIVPSMGSHGGASAEGQKNVLNNLGITEELMGCEIRSTMDVVEVGRLPNGLAVLIDKYAYEADGIILLNRIKPHTAFRGPCESGLAKMLSIGLGNQKGADSCHAYTFTHMAEFVVEMAKIKLAHAKVLFGIATIENAYDKVAKIVGVAADDILEVEPILLEEAKALMPRIMFDTIDVLVVDEIGKEISGGGMDGNVTGRYAIQGLSGGPQVDKIALLRLSDKTHGNANGMGIADTTTKSVFDEIDYESTYINCITTLLAIPCKVPMVLESDKLAVAAAIKLAAQQNSKELKLVRILDTLHLEEIYISEALLPQAQTNAAIEVVGELEVMKFDELGNLM